MAANKVVLPVQKNEASGVIYPKVFVYTEPLTVTDVILSTGADSAQFRIGSTAYTQSSLVNQTLPAGAELVTENIAVGGGHENAGVVIIF